MPMDQLNHASATLASGQALIDIDATVVVQFALFLILFLVANKFLFQPYLKLRELRRTETEGARKESERMTAEADAKLADYEKQLAIARARANEEAGKVRAEASQHERTVTEQARTSAVKSIEEAQTKVRTETEAARAELMPQAQVIARTIASKLLGREVA